MVYALYDWTARKGNSSYGFSNTKRAIAFSSIAKRDFFLSSRKEYDFSARKITRQEALKMLEPMPNGEGKGLPLDELYTFTCLRPSKY
jgi:hypothetical protein